MDVDTFVNLQRVIERDDWHTDEYGELWKGIIERLPQGVRYKKAFDMGCGHGQLAGLLCERADEVVAVDCFEQMLKEVPRNAPRAKPLLATMLMVDMRGADLVVFCESLYYQTPEEQVRLLLQAAACRADIIVTYPDTKVSDCTLRVLENGSLYMTTRSTIHVRGATKQMVMFRATGSPLVRLAEPSDADAIWRGLHGCNEGTVVLYHPFAYTEGTAKALATPLYQRLRNTTVYVTILDETMVALGRLHHVRENAYAIDCMVTDPFRRCGFGRIMLDHLLSQVPKGATCYTQGGTHAGEILHWLLRKRGFTEHVSAPLDLPPTGLGPGMVMMTKVMP